MNKGLKLFHRDLGGAGLPPLVILHGILGSSRNWQTAGADLSRSHHVLAVDLRNHGGSPHAPEMSFGAMVGDVIDWIDALGLRRVTLMGHSMGGKVAMLLACRHAERVERLIVVDIAPKDYFWKGQRAAFAAMNELDLEHLRSRAEAEQRFEAHVPDGPMRKFLATNLERAEAGGWRWQINLPVLFSALSALERNPLGPEDRFTGPVLLISGGLSPYVVAADWEAVTAHFPAATWRVMAQSGHNPHMDARLEFVRCVGEGP